MRLTSSQVQITKNTVARVLDSSYRVWLFGSRAEAICRLYGALILALGDRKNNTRNCQKRLTPLREGLVDYKITLEKSLYRDLLHCWARLQSRYWMFCLMLKKWAGLTILKRSLVQENLETYLYMNT